MQVGLSRLAIHVRLSFLSSIYHTYHPYPLHFPSPCSLDHHTALKLSVSPSVKATGTVEAHFIPSLNLKVSALGDVVEAGIFLELDASAEMTLSLEAQAEGSLTIDKAKAAPAVKGRYWPREPAQAA